MYNCTCILFSTAHNNGTGTVPSATGYCGNTGVGPQTEVFITKQRPGRNTCLFWENKYFCFVARGYDIIEKLALRNATVNPNGLKIGMKLWTKCPEQNIQILSLVECHSDLTSSNHSKLPLPAKHHLINCLRWFHVYTFSAIDSFHSIMYKRKHQAFYMNPSITMLS